MKYIVVEIQANANGTVGILTDSFENFQEADRKFHLVLAAAAVSEVETHSCVMLASDGRHLKADTYSHKAEEPEDPEVM